MLSPGPSVSVVVKTVCVWIQNTEKETWKQILSITQHYLHTVTHSELIYTSLLECVCVVKQREGLWVSVTHRDRLADSHANLSEAHSMSCLSSGQWCCVSISIQKNTHLLMFGSVSRCAPANAVTRYCDCFAMGFMNGFSVI